MEDFEPHARLFRTLMHPARLAILEMLRDREECVCHLEAALGYRQAYISQQLMVLRDAGLVKDRREGWNNYYRVVQSEIFAVIEAAGAVTSGGRRRGARLPRPATLDNCPCPRCAPEAQPVPR